MKSRVIFFIVAYGLWLLLSHSADWPHLVVGAAVGLGVTAIAGDLFVTRPEKMRMARYGWFLLYVPVFVWECFKANLDVAYRVLHPGLPIRPGIVKVRTRLNSDVGLTFLANSITLTPGTLCVDVDREQGVLYIHWIHVKDTDTEAATRTIVRRFENLLVRMFE